MAANSKPNSYSHDLTRDEIINRFRSRIAQSKRTKLTKDELGQLILHFTDRLQPLNSAAEIQALCDFEIALLEEGYPQSTLASDYIPKYRKAIETALAQGKIPTSKNNSHRYIHTQRVTGLEEERFEHYALTYFKYDKEVYESLARRSALSNQKRQVSLRKVEPNQYLLKLGDLLDTQDKFAARLQALAIAGLTGRRIGEVLTKGNFQLSTHPHLLRFEGHQKTAVAAYEIVTLIPAEQLLEYIQQFRARDEIGSLLELSGETLAKAINQLDVQINRECVKHLSGIVPPLTARSSISIHNLRSLWGAIAVWLFCPDNQHEYPFIQHYLGHAIDSNATGHYFRYQLVDKAGHPLRDKGVKLSQVGELPLFTDRTATASTLTKTDTPPQTPTADTPAPISPTQSALVDTVAATPGADTPDQIPAPPAPATPLSEIPAGIDVPENTAAAQPTLPDTVLSPATSDGDSNNEQIKVDKTIPPVTQPSAIEKDSPATAATPSVVPAATSNTDSLIVTLSYYECDRHRLSQLLDTVSPIDTSQQEKIAALLDWAEQQLSHKTRYDTQPNRQPDSQYSVASSEVTPKVAQRVDLAADGILVLCDPTPESSSPPAQTSISPLELLVTQAVTDQARTLGVLASRVETLETQVSQLQLERDRALDQLTIAQNIPGDLTQQLDSLQAENTHLRQELDRFEAIRRAFLGEPPPQSGTSAPASAPASTQTTSTLVSAPVLAPIDANATLASAPAPASTQADATSPASVSTSTADSTSNDAVGLPQTAIASSPSKSPPKAKSSDSSDRSTGGNRPRRKGAAKARAERIFRALIAWNEQHADDTFAMTDWLLEGVFKVNRKAAKQFCQDFHDAIEQHHAQVGIDNIRSHNSGRDTSALKSFISSFTQQA